MTHGRQRLREWIDRSRLTQRAAAKLLGFDYTFLSQILSGRRSPGLANAVVIETVTGVSVRSWTTTGVGEAADGVSRGDAKARQVNE